MRRAEDNVCSTCSTLVNDGEKATTARGTAASLYLSLYYFGGSLGAVLPGFALLWAGWPGVVSLCLGAVLIALASDAVLCR